jgi:hypothetical protein
MADFLRGFLSAKPIRDPAADMMRAAAGEDYRQQLRQRRVMRELPGFMRGDPAAEMSLAALGIGRGPESAREADRYREATQAREQARTAAQEQVAWQRGFAEEGREIAQSRSEKAEAAREKRFEDEMGFRKEVEQKADVRRKAAAESAAFDKLEAERERKEEKAYRRKRDAATAERSAEAAQRAAESHKIMMRRADRAEQERLDQEAITKNVGIGLKKRMVSKIDQYMGPLPPADTPEGALATAQRVQLQGKVYEDYLTFGGNSKSIADRKAAYEQALDENFPQQRRQEAMIEQMENMFEIELVKAELPEKIEAELARRQEKRKAEKGLEERRKRTREKIRRRKEEADRPKVAPWVPGLRPGTREELPEQRGAIEDILRSLPAGPAGAQILDMLGL